MNNNNNNNKYSGTVFIVLSSMALSHVQEFTLGPLSESLSVPGGSQPVGQAANLTF